MAAHRLAWLTCDTEGCNGSTLEGGGAETVTDARREAWGFWSTSLYGIKGDFCGQCVANARAASGSVRT